MKSKEEIFKMHYAKLMEAHPGEYNELKENDDMPEIQVAYDMMQEYADQQTAALRAERDEYRKALESIIKTPANSLTHGTIAAHALYKYKNHESAELNS